MQFEVMSRRDAVKYTKREHKESSIIISISDSYDFFPNFDNRHDNGVKSILNLSFDDVQENLKVFENPAFITPVRA